MSHGHGKLISDLQCLCSLNKSDSIRVVIVDNVGESELKEYCQLNQIDYICNDSAKGFGENNNLAFDYVSSKYNPERNDKFLVLNPDVCVEDGVIIDLSKQMDELKSEVATINLFKDDRYSVPDNSVRKFPTLLDLSRSFVGLKNNTIIDKSKLKTPSVVDWAAGSFLMFSCEHYRSLQGFDSMYFMYCEDVDICYRSTRAGMPVTIFPELKGLHLASHANRNVFSKHFYWHVSSALKFLMRKNGIAF
ncbi:glycosyltransferase family 2 protein [Ferrimonas balearica]|uniref:glycosyltransferase family 2 protein n=1 Tax=Ferrimonas balearica TaxID=44012 RepID=UPI001C0A8DF4|nr:glycosyltransferase family 2 protein [Ferrimonas balearica]